MISHSSISLEYVKFQFKSGLGKQLETIYQDFIDYKKKFDTENALNKINPKKVLQYHSAISNYFNKITFTSIQKLLKDKCNIILQRTYQQEMNPILEDNIIGAIQIYPNHNDVILVITQQLQKTFGFKISSTSDLDKIFKTYMNKANAFDHSTGKFNFPIESTLILEPNILLFPEFTFSGVTEFTASEMTAITLHEIGHVYNNIFNLFNIYNNAYLASSVFSQCMNLKVEDKIKLINRNKSFFKNNIENNDLIDKELKKKVIEYNSMILDKLSSSDTLSATILANSIRKIIATITFTFNFRFNNILQTLQKSLREYLYSIFGQALLINNTLSDIPELETKTLRSFRKSEINADDFVSMYGYNKGLISGLEKISKILMTYSKTNELKFNMFGFIPLWLNFISSIKLLLPPILTGPIMAKEFSGYEKYHKRLERLVNSFNNQLKNTNLTPQVRNLILKDIESSKKLLKKSYLYTTSKYVHKFWDLVLGTALIRNLILDVYDGKTIAEIEKVLNEIDKLNSNSMYYHSAKLKSLL